MCSLPPGEATDTASVSSRGQEVRLSLTSSSFQSVQTPQWSGRVVAEVVGGSAAQVAEGLAFQGADLVCGQLEVGGGLVDRRWGVAVQAVPVAQDLLMEVVQELQLVRDVPA